MRALLSYITHPFRLPEGQPVVQFSNLGIAQNIVRVLRDLGYDVDVIDYFDQTFASARSYDLFVGHMGANWEYLTRNVVGDAVRIYFATTINWRRWNEHEEQRFASLEQRHGVRLPYDRWIEDSEDVAYHTADGIICLGNRTAADSFAGLPLVLPIDNAVFPDERFDTVGKDYEAGRRRFLFFGGWGNVHKGLDRLVDAFVGSDCELFCATRFDPPFLDLYGPTITAAPNIHFFDWVQMRSPQFYALADSCNAVIFPTCGEGQPGSVLECMNNGLFPIVSRDANMDVDDAGIELATASVEEIRSVVAEVASRPTAWHAQLGGKARAQATTRYAESTYYAAFRAAVEKIVENAPTIRAARLRTADAARTDPDAYVREHREDLGALLAGARVLHDAGENPASRTLWERAAAVDPGCVEAQGALGELCLALDPAAAAAYADRVLKRNWCDEQARRLSRRAAGGGADPIVSAIVSTYAAAALLPGCLEDLLCQSLADRLEIIVVDSGSPERERSIVDEYRRQFANIVYIRTDQRETIYSAWNRGVRAARGRYLTNANTDDRHHPEALARLVGALENDVGAALAYGNIAVTGVEGAAFGTVRPQGHFLWPDFDARELFRVCFCGPQPLWRRELHDRYGFFDETFRSAGDYEFWLRIAPYERFVHIPEILGLYLDSGTSVEHANGAISIAESEEARRRHWPASWGACPSAAGNYYAVAAEAAQAVESELFTVVAFMSDLLRSPALLAAFGQTFSGADPTRLVIYAPGEDAYSAEAALRPLVAAARLDRPDAADLLALAIPQEVEQERLIAGRADAVLSDTRVEGPLGLLPRFGEQALGDLRRVAEIGWAARRSALVAA